MDIYIFIHVFGVISQFCATLPMHTYVRKGKFIGSGPSPTKDGAKIDSKTKRTEKMNSLLNTDT